MLLAGIKINEPSIDLGICVATISSLKNTAIDPKIVVIGEVGLTGEVRNVSLMDKRLHEAEKLGYQKCIIPESNKKHLKDSYKLDIIGVKNINEAIKALGLM